VGLRIERLDLCFFWRAYAALSPQFTTRPGRFVLGFRIASGLQSFAPEKTNGRRRTNVERASAPKLSGRRFPFSSAHDLDQSRNVPRHRVRFPIRRNNVRPTTIGAHHSFLPCSVHGSVSVCTRSHGVPYGIQTTYTRHDHGLQCRQKGPMSNRLTRRKLITTGFATAAGVSGLAIAARIADRYGLIPPDHQGILGVGETLTYASQRILTSHHSFARELNRSEISKVAPVLGNPPEIETYQRLVAGGFADWRLTVGGLVSRPASLTLGELKRFPVRSQITHQACEEGWSFVAESVGFLSSTS
jgi:Oxidoreductase molybdopterin binding domain